MFCMYPPSNCYFIVKLRFRSRSQVKSRSGPAGLRTEDKDLDLGLDWSTLIWNLSFCQSLLLILLGQDVPSPGLVWPGELQTGLINMEQLYRQVFFSELKTRWKELSLDDGCLDMLCLITPTSVTISGGLRAGLITRVYTAAEKSGRRRCYIF